LPHDVTPYVAIVAAGAILGAFYLISTRDIGRSALGWLAAMAAVLVISAGVAGALKGEHPIEEEGESAEATEAEAAAKTDAEGATGKAANPAKFELSADNIAFNTEELDFPASTAITLHFKNADQAPHNFSLYEEEGGKALFKGSVINAGKATDYKFSTPTGGTYFFQCDVHPALMKGVANVSIEASDAPDQGENATTTSTSVR
jgi:plastocyanin